MYNLPHQINDLAKLYSALGVFRALEARLKNLGDDGVVGIAMARARVYTFRDKRLSVRDALRKELRKTPSNQGTRTFARDLRRFFSLLGFLRTDIEGDTELSPMGIHLLGLPATGDEARAVWRTALRHLVLVDQDDESVSHPYSTLLRLVAARPGIEAARLALALEARNDSDAEFERILGLSDVEDWQRAREEMDVSEHFARDATKILPALGRQLGELRTEGNRYFRTEPEVRPAEKTDLIDEEEVRDGIKRRRKRRAPRGRSNRIITIGGNRKVDPRTIARAPRPGAQPPDEVEFADPALTAELRRERLSRHEGMVRTLAEILSDCDLYEDPYDVLGVPENGAAVLAEAKTLDGTTRDEIAQVRAALGQLLYYDAFHVPTKHRDKGLVRLAVFEHRVAEDHIAFLESLEVAVAWLTEEGRLMSSGWSLAVLRDAAIVAEEAV